MWHWILDRLRGRTEPSNLEALEAEVLERLEDMAASSSRWLAVVKRLDVRLESKSARAGKLEERVRAYRRVGRGPIAADLDRELTRLQNEIQEDTKELEDARRLYATHVRKTDAIRSLFREKAREIERLQDQTALKELQIEIDSLLADASKEVEGFLERAKSIESDLGAHHDEVAAKVRVARDLADVERLDKAPE